MKRTGMRRDDEFLGSMMVSWIRYRRSGKIICRPSISWNRLPPPLEAAGHR